jgi:hypothetical protein
MPMPNDQQAMLFGARIDRPNLLALGKILAEVDLDTFSTCAPSHKSECVSAIICKKATSHENPDFQVLMDGFLWYKNEDYEFKSCILTRNFACLVSEETFHFFEDVNGVSPSVNP